MVSGRAQCGVHAARVRQQRVLAPHEGVGSILDCIAFLVAHLLRVQHRHLHVAVNAASAHGAHTMLLYKQLRRAWWSISAPSSAHGANISVFTRAFAFHVDGESRFFMSLLPRWL